MSTPNHSQYAFVFICKGPDPGGMRPANMVMTDRGVYEGLVQSFGFGGSAENVFFYGPDWNSTVYSSSVITGSEGDDLMGKVKAAMSAKGFTYNGEPVRSVSYDPSTTYGQMGFIMVFLFAEKTAEPDAVSFAMSAAAPVAAPVAEPVAAPVAEPVAASVAEPVAAPVAEPVENTKKKKSVLRTLLIILGAVVGAGVLLTAGLLFWTYRNHQNDYEAALAALKEYNYADAYDGFTRLGSFKDSESLAKETMYQQGYALLCSEEYEQAKHSFERIGDYKNSVDEAHYAVYLYAKQLADDNRYEEAVSLLEKLRDEGLTTIYHYEDPYETEDADEDEDADVAEEAEPIEEYRLEDEINKMKYACIKDRWDDTDATVDKYIDELTQAKYEDADTLYNRLHGFKLVNLFFTNSRNGTSHLASIDKKSMIVCRFDVVNPLSSTDTTHISYKIALPNGVTLISAPSDVTFKDGQNGYWSWRAGSYNDVYGFGTLTITFFNEYKDVIGQASVEITE